MLPAMFRLSSKPLSDRHLSFAEREANAPLRTQGCSMQDIARRIGERPRPQGPRRLGDTPPRSQTSRIASISNSRPNLRRCTA